MDGGADTASDASGDRELSKPKTGTAATKKAKIPKEGNNNDSIRTNFSGAKTKPVPDAAYNQPRAHPKHPPLVSGDPDTDMERPKKKLKVRA